MNCFLLAEIGAQAVHLIGQLRQLAAHLFETRLALVEHARGGRTRTRLGLRVQRSRNLVHVDADALRLGCHTLRVGVPRHDVRRFNIPALYLLHATAEKCGAGHLFLGANRVQRGKLLIRKPNLNRALLVRLFLILLIGGLYSVLSVTVDLFLGMMILIFACFVMTTSAF